MLITIRWSRLLRNARAGIARGWTGGCLVGSLMSGSTRSSPSCVRTETGRWSRSGSRPGLGPRRCCRQRGRHVRITAAQRLQNENRIRAAIDRLLRGEIPSGGRCDVKTLAAEAGVDRTAFYGARPYAHLRIEFEQRLRAMQQTGDIPDPATRRSCDSKPTTAHSASGSPRPPARSTNSPTSAHKPSRAWPPSTRKSPAYVRRLTRTPERRSHASHGATRSSAPAETGRRQPKPQVQQADPSPRTESSRQ